MVFSFGVQIYTGFPAKQDRCRVMEESLKGRRVKLLENGTFSSCFTGDSGVVAPVRARQSVEEVWQWLMWDSHNWQQAELREGGAKEAGEAGGGACLSGKVFIFSSLLRDSFTRYRILCWWVFLFCFSVLNVSLHFLLFKYLIYLLNFNFLKLKYSWLTALC